MSEKTNYLIAVDKTPESSTALDFALKLLSADDVVLRLVHVHDAAVDPDALAGMKSAHVSALREFVKKEHEEASAVLQGLHERATKAGFEATADLVLARAKPLGEVIVDEAESSGAAVVVMGARSQGMVGRLLWGSVSTYIAHNCHCSVLVVKSALKDGPASFLVALDFSPVSDAALTTTLSLARDTDFIQGLHVAPTNGPAVTEEIVKRSHRLSRMGIKVVRGEPRKAIVDEVKDRNTNILALGSRGVGTLERIVLGSVSSYCLHEAPCAAVLIHK